MHRQIILDTETTGLDTTRNHKIIEIGCIEIVDRKYTGKDFHFYFVELISTKYLMEREMRMRNWKSRLKFWKSN